MQRTAILGLAAIGLLASPAGAHSSHSPHSQGGDGPARGRGAGREQGPPPAPEADAILPLGIAGATPAERLHQDEGGQAERRLLSLAGDSKAGFAALWTDLRHGYPAVYLRCFDPSGAPRGEERPVRERSSLAPELGASLALGPGGKGAVVWSLADATLGPGVFQVRSFEPGGVFAGPAELVRSGPASGARGEAGELLPRALVGADGSVKVAWIHGGRARFSELGGETRLLDPLRGAEVPNGPDDSEEPGPEGAVLFVVGPGGAPLALWNGGEQVLAVALTPGSKPADCGSGRLLAAAPDPRVEGGAWLLLLAPGSAGERMVLRPLDARGMTAGEDLRISKALPEHVDLASWSEGLALVFQELGSAAAGVTGAPGANGGPFEVRFFNADGTPSARAPVPFVAGREAQALEPRVAGAGETLLVAWSERRAGSLGGLDVRGRLLRAGEAELGPELSLAGARATSHQSKPVAASVTDRRAVVVWLDERGGHPLPYARLVSRAGDPMGAELRIPAGAPGEPGEPLDPGPISDPHVAMGPAGDVLVGWLEQGGLACQAFQPDLRPVQAPCVVAARPARERGYALIRQESFRSWLFAWAEPTGLFVRRVRGDGTPLAQPTAVAAAEQATRPALLELPDRRVVVAWEEPGGGTQIKLRLLYAELHAATEALEVPAPASAAHRGPCLAPAPGGGFLLAWTAELSPSETIIAALEFDRDAEPLGDVRSLSEPRGREEGLCLTVLDDGSWLVGFTVEGAPGSRIAVRRLRPGKAAAGPLRLLDPPAQGYRVGSQEPALVGVGGGWLGFWVDAHRGQGLDVWFRRAGLDFDREP